MSSDFVYNIVMINHAKTINIMFINTPLKTGMEMTKLWQYQDKLVQLLKIQFHKCSRTLDHYLVYNYC